MNQQPPTAIRVTLTGRVQGLGVRPAVAQLARRLSLTGWVSNTCAGVEIVAEGAPDHLDRFTRELFEQLPGGTLVESHSCASISPPRNKTFEIRRESTAGALQARVPLDLVVCEPCRLEAQGKSLRRTGYAFTSCTACGPRYSIVETMPYERDGTTMRKFPLCAACQREYDSPDDRRFHAETNACPACGPRWWQLDKSGTRVALGDEAIGNCAAALRRGEIVALQGLGGYQLLVDATSPAAVQRLRNHKQRLSKPFAVMVGSLEEAQRLASGCASEWEALCSSAGPIVVLRRKESTGIASNVGPGLNTLGIMLPTTLQHYFLLVALGRPLVVTSGNREGEPLEYEHDGASARLADIADLWLEHDRPIRHPVDDSVVRVMGGRCAVLRAARGFAPLPLQLSTRTPLLAVGGQQKGAIALCNGEQAILGPHIGDLNSVAERTRWESQLANLLTLYGCSPTRLAGDYHPDYASTRWANEQPLPLVAVQHHHAHIVAGQIEHHWLDRTVLGVAFDGTGWGTDGTVWGGEFLCASASEFRRVGHLLACELPGVERAIREPWRIAVSLVQRAAGNEIAATLAFASGTGDAILPLLGRPQLSPRTTSAGRLFDGVAALVLGVEIAEFEGQGPMLLEAACDRSARGRYTLALSDSTPCVLDWRPAIRELLTDRHAKIPPGVMAMRFHRGLAEGIFALAQRFPQWPVVLSGGCFQNRLLVELLAEQWADSPQALGLPGLIPVNDGGLAAGQLAVTAALISKGR